MQQFVCSVQSPSVHINYTQSVSIHYGSGKAPCRPGLARVSCWITRHPSILTCYCVAILSCLFLFSTLYFTCDIMHGWNYVHAMHSVCSFCVCFCQRDEDPQVLLTAIECASLVTSTLDRDALAGCFKLVCIAYASAWAVHRWFRLLCARNVIWALCQQFFFTSKM